MSGELIGLVHNETEKILMINERKNYLRVPVHSKVDSVDIVLGELIKIEQYHYSKDLELRSFKLTYQHVKGVVFERFVTSEQYSPIFYRDMTPKFKVGQLIVPYGYDTLNRPEVIKRSKIVREVLETKYSLYSENTRNIEYADIDQTNELYVLYKD